MKITKDEARQQIDVYGNLLQERAVISEIEQEPVRNETRYTFTIYNTKYPVQMECLGVKNLALVLTSMWSAYLKAYEEVGFGLDCSSI